MRTKSGSAGDIVRDLSPLKKYYSNAQGCYSGAFSARRFLAAREASHRPLFFMA